MRKQKINPTDEFVSKQTTKSKEILSKIDLSLKNTNTEESRTSQQLCQACFYSPPKLFTQAFYETNCCYCDDEMTFGSGDTDYSCEKCAREEDVCKKCCGKID